MYVLNLKSSSKNSLLLYSVFLKRVLINLSVMHLAIFLPGKVKKITLLKSPHVYKKSKEQFEIYTFSATFYIYSNFNIKILKYLLFNKPKSIHLKLKFLER